MQFAPFCSFGVSCLSNLNNSILHITWSMKHFIPSGGDYMCASVTRFGEHRPPLYIQNVFQRFLFSFVVVFLFLCSERHCFPLLLPLFSFLLLFFLCIWLLIYREWAKVATVCLFSFSERTPMHAVSAEQERFWCTLTIAIVPHHPPLFLCVYDCPLYCCFCLYLPMCVRRVEVNTSARTRTL